MPACGPYNTREGPTSKTAHAYTYLISTINYIILSAPRYTDDLLALLYVDFLYRVVIRFSINQSINLQLTQATWPKKQQNRETRTCRQVSSCVEFVQ